MFTVYFPSLECKPHEGISAYFEDSWSPPSACPWCIMEVQGLLPGAEEGSKQQQAGWERALLAREVEQFQGSGDQTRGQA